MKEVVLVVAPHPDDETLGCGATMLKHLASSDEVHWMVVTEMKSTLGFSGERMIKRQHEIESAVKAYGLTQIHHLGFPVMQLDTVPMSDLVASISTVVEKIKPTILYLPYRGDVHSDHAVVFDAATSCTKHFRYPSVKTVRVYETLSETNFGLNTQDSGFLPNLFADVTDYFDKKLEIMHIFESELGQHPFPRSIQSLDALAVLRGSQAGCQKAEAFMQIKHIC